MTLAMNNDETPNLHLDEDQIDEAARALVDGLGNAANGFHCAECESEVRLHARVLQLARLLALDSRVPAGTPAIDAVRSIRRRSYHRRALGELATILTAMPQRERV